MLFILLCSVFTTTLAVSSSWRPIHPAQLSTSILHQEAAVYGGAGHSIYNLEESSLSEQLLGQQDQDTCALYKVAMNQQLYFEVSAQ